MSNKVWWAEVRYYQKKLRPKKGGWTKGRNYRTATITAPTKGKLDYAIKKERKRTDFHIEVLKRGSYSRAMWNWKKW